MNRYYIMDTNSGKVFGRVKKDDIDTVAEKIAKAHPTSEPYVFIDKDLKDFTGSQLVQMYNANSSQSPIKKFASKSVAVNRVTQVLDDLGWAEPTGEESSMEGQTKRERIPGDAKITVLAEENPKREGTNAHDMFELYEDGMTVDEYVQAGGDRSAVRWDLDKGFIEVES